MPLPRRFRAALGGRGRLQPRRRRPARRLDHHVARSRRGRHGRPATAVATVRAHQRCTRRPAAAPHAARHRQRRPRGRTRVSRGRGFRCHTTTLARLRRALPARHGGDAGRHRVRRARRRHRPGRTARPRERPPAPDVLARQPARRTAPGCAAVRRRHGAAVRLPRGRLHPRRADPVPGQATRTVYIGANDAAYGRRRGGAVALAPSRTAHARRMHPGDEPDRRGRLRAVGALCDRAARPEHDRLRPGRQRVPARVGRRRRGGRAARRDRGGAVRVARTVLGGVRGRLREIEVSRSAP